MIMATATNMIMMTMVTVMMAIIMLAMLTTMMMLILRAVEMIAIMTIAMAGRRGAGKMRTETNFGGALHGGAGTDGGIIDMQVRRQTDRDACI